MISRIPETPTTVVTLSMRQGNGLALAVTMNPARFERTKITLITREIPSVTGALPKFVTPGKKEVKFEQEARPQKRQKCEWNLAKGIQLQKLK